MDAVRTKPKLYDFSKSLSQAGAVLAANGNRIKLICLFLLLSLFLMSALLFTAAFFLLLNTLPLAPPQITMLALVTYAIPLFLLILFWVLPFLQGILTVAYRMARYEDVPLVAVFRPFSKDQLYWRHVAISWDFFWKALILGAAIFLTYESGDTLFSGNFWGGLATALAIVAEIAVWFFWCGRNFGLLFFALQEERMPLRSAKKKVKAFWKVNPFAAFRYFGNFLPHILLGILTLGVYLLADVLPRMVLTYCFEAENTYELMIQLEENKDHE